MLYLLHVGDDCEKSQPDFEKPFLTSVSSRCRVSGLFFTGQFTIAVDQLSGADVAMGEQGDNACVECLVMKCVGAEHLQ